jgi:hypothetical protein
MFLVALVAGAAFFAPKKFQRLRNLALWRTPEQKRLLKAYDGPPKAPSAGPRTYYVPKH